MNICSPYIFVDIQMIEILKVAEKCKIYEIKGPRKARETFDRTFARVAWICQILNQVTSGLLGRMVTLGID